MFVFCVQLDTPCPTDGHRKCSLSDNQEKLILITHIPHKKQCLIDHINSTQKAVIYPLNFKIIACDCVNAQSTLSRNIINLHAKRMCNVH